VKQEVIVGDTNANDAVITAGLQEEERLYLSIPTGHEGDKVNLLPELNGKRQNKNKERRQSRSGSKGS